MRNYELEQPVLTRRQFLSLALFSGSALLMEGCLNKDRTSSPTPVVKSRAELSPGQKPRLTPEQLSPLIEKDVVRIAKEGLINEPGLPADSAAILLKSTKPSTLNPNFADFVIKGAVIEQDIATGVSSVTLVPSIREFQVKDRSGNINKLKAPEKIIFETGFSEYWLRNLNDLIKSITLMEQTSYLLMWSHASTWLANNYLKGAQITRDPGITDQQIKDAIFYDAFVRYQDINQSRQFAASYRVMPWVHRIMISQNPLDGQGLENTVYDSLYKASQARGINLNIPPDTDEFESYMYDPTSPWYRLVRDVFPIIPKKEGGPNMPPSLKF